MMLGQGSPSTPFVQMGEEDQRLVGRAHETLYSFHHFRKRQLRSLELQLTEEEKLRTRLGQTTSIIK